jgi:hypothetical protein
MTRGAMLIVEITAFESLFLVIYYRSSVGLVAVESRSGCEE